MNFNQLKNIFPGLKFLHNYNRKHAITDFIAGITVGLTVLPQGLAYSVLAGLEPQYGLYSAIMGGFLYALFGTCRELTIGPTALLALMTSRHTSLGGDSGPDLAITLCFLAGIVECLMAVLRLGALVDLISLPVTVGFTSATAIIIGTSQLKGLLGLKGGSNSGFIETIRSVILNLNEFRVGDVSLGIFSIVILLVLRKLKDIKTPEDASQKRRIIGGILWTIITARNALIVLCSSLAAFIAEQYNMTPFILTGKVRSGLPNLQLPPFETTRLEKTTNGTSTIVKMDFSDMLSELGPTIIMLPVIAVLGNVAISKAFIGSSIDATRELFALSFSNIFGSLVSSIPVTGSFSRSAVNHASGVKTPIGGIYTSILVLLALGILTPYFQYIPKAALSAVIITAVIFMIEYEVIRPLWRCSRRELLPGAVTFVLSLAIGVEIGLLFGVAVDCGYLILRAARPALTVDKLETISDIHYVLIKPKYSLLSFPAIEWLRSRIGKVAKEYGFLPIVLDCRQLNEFDFTVARGLGALHKEFTARNCPFILLGADGSIKTVLQEATNMNICQVSNETDLDCLLKEINADKLKNVILPLLAGTTTTNATTNVDNDEENL